MNGWETKTPQPQNPERPPTELEPVLPEPDQGHPELDGDPEDNREDDLGDTAEDDDVDAPRSDPILPPMHAHGDADSAAAEKLVGQASDSSSRIRVAFRTMGCRQDIYRV